MDGSKTDTDTSGHLFNEEVSGREAYCMGRRVSVRRLGPCSIENPASSSNIYG